MVRFALARWAPALAVVVLAGCAGSAVDGTGTSEGASTVAPTAPAHATLAGDYGGDGHGEWDGSLAITNASSDSFDFEFEISPAREDIGRIGRLGGTAMREDGHYRYADGGCILDFKEAANDPGSVPGDLLVDAGLTCGIWLGIDGHTTGSTAFDLSATWRRYPR